VEVDHSARRDTARGGDFVEVLAVVERGYLDQTTWPCRTPKVRTQIEEKAFEFAEREALPIVEDEKGGISGHRLFDSFKAAITETIVEGPDAAHCLFIKRRAELNRRREVADRQYPRPG
jgi:hypothetical protein